MERDPQLEILIDVAERDLRAEVGLDESFPLDEFTQHRLLEGLDDIGLTLRHADKIAAYESRRRSGCPGFSQPDR